MRAFIRLLAVGLAALALSGAAEAAYVPAGVSSIRIRSATGITTTVTGPSAVKAIVAAFNALPPFVARPCPYPLYRPPDVTFDFRAANGAVLLHALDRAPGTCAGEITTTGQKLADNGFVARVSAMLGDVDPNPRTAANERLAQRDAAHLLRLAVVPPGSRRLTTTPKELAVSGQRLTTSPFQDRIWKVRMSVDAVVAFERAHRPRGSTITYQDTTNNRRGELTSRGLGFAFPAIRNRVSTRSLTVEIAPLRRPSGRESGWTGIRIGAWDDWVVAHDPDEVVPSGVRTIEIRKGSLLVHRFTTAQTVGKIIRWFDALPVSPPAGPCSPIFQIGRASC